MWIVSWFQWLLVNPLPFHGHKSSLQGLHENQPDTFRGLSTPCAESEPSSMTIREHDWLATIPHCWPDTDFVHQQLSYWYLDDPRKVHRLQSKRYDHTMTLRFSSKRASSSQQDRQRLHKTWWVFMISFLAMNSCILKKTIKAVRPC